MTILHKSVPFIFKNGRYVRDTRGKPVAIRSQVKGDSLSKFPRLVGRIGWHKWN